jgi:hypothetical protein
MRPEKMRFLKHNKWVRLLPLLILYSCTSGGQYWRVRVEMPRPVSFELDRFQEMIVTDFLVMKKRTDFDLNKETTEYFAFEFEKNAQIPVLRVDVVPESIETFKQEDFWTKIPTENKDAIVFTGTIDYRSEVRKALVDREKRQFEDPFPDSTALEERKFFTLFFNLYLIDSKTGKTLYHKDFKETRNYQNPNQTAYFAYFDLIQSVKDKLFQAFLGEELLQERYLINK